MAAITQIAGSIRDAAQVSGESTDSAPHTTQAALELTQRAQELNVLVGRLTY
ncbi:MAG: hypothetical protein ABI746_11165 [Dermatophilaceae bacterium]